MEKIVREFVSRETRHYPYRLGRTIGSALSGFVAGAVSVGITVVAIIQYVLPN